MKKLRNSTLWVLIERVLPWFVLAILLFYTYSKFFGHPYGFRWQGSTAEVIFVFDNQQSEPTLHVGDKLIRIGDVTWEMFSEDLLQTFFNGVKPGETVPLTVERSGQAIQIDWVYPSQPLRDEVLDQLISEWFIAYFFWLAGLVTMIVVRPKDEQWLVMALFNFLTAIWLAAGSGVSSFHTGGSALVLRMAIWLCVPLYLHLHWLFPRPLGKLPPLVVTSVYGIAILFVVAQGFQLIPDDFFFVGFLVALGGSLVLLLIHILRQPAVLRDLRLVFVTVLLALALAVIWQIIYFSLHKIPAWLGSAGLLGLPLLPLAYLYSAFRYRLGGLEIRVNRFFSIYLFIVLLGIVELPLVIFLDEILQMAGEASAISLISSVSTAAAFIWGYPVFENFVEHRLLGIPLPSKRLLESFSTHITTSVSLPGLVRVLEEEILPSLLIRQFAFLHYDQGSFSLLSKRGLNAESLPDEKDVTDLLADAGSYLSPDLGESNQSYAWIRLVLPLKLSDQLTGLWLLGRRDPDDFYSQREILTLTSLANLTAIALSNILQTERLTSVYRANINRYEEDRVRLARDLHDVILNELAALPIRPDAPVFSPTFQHAYNDVSEQLREIVHGLRPPMLAFGLKLALEAYGEHLRERKQDSVEILTDIQVEEECRYPLLVESNLYRIVQEACENSLRYAQAKRLSITGSLDEKQIYLKVEDDGIGLDPQISLKLDDLALHKHFGLTSMHERASVIGAVLDIASQSNKGTQVYVIWKPKESV